MDVCFNQDLEECCELHVAAILVLAILTSVQVMSEGILLIIGIAFIMSNFSKAVSDNLQGKVVYFVLLRHVTKVGEMPLMWYALLYTHLKAHFVRIIIRTVIRMTIIAFIIFI